MPQVHTSLHSIKLAHVSLLCSSHRLESQVLFILNFIENVSSKLTNEVSSANYSLASTRSEMISQQQYLCAKLGISPKLLVVLLVHEEYPQIVLSLRI